MTNQATALNVSEIRLAILTTTEVYEQLLKECALQHSHDLCEMILVTQGCCKVMHNRSCILLLPGDILILDSNQPHSYDMQKTAMAYQCHFSKKLMPAAMKEMFDTAWGVPMNISQSIQQLSASEISDLQDHSKGSLILHLEPEEQKGIYTLVHNIEQEQLHSDISYQDMQRAYLSQLLIQLSRIQTVHHQSKAQEFSWKQELIDSILRQINESFEQDPDFQSIAKENGLSYGYFRSVFRKIVGMAPGEYVNRLRIVKALELLQVSNLSIADTAAQVGIPDANYFSRQFKKIIGYPPSYFKSINNC